MNMYVHSAVKNSRMTCVWSKKQSLSVFINTQLTSDGCVNDTPTGHKALTTYIKWQIWIT